MFTKDEKKELTKKFWMLLSEKLDKSGKEDGRNVDWMNYPNKINNLYFRMEADTESVKFCIDIQFLFPGVREIYFQQFEEFQVKLKEIMPMEFIWLKEYDHWNGKTISRLYVELKDVSIFSEDTWSKSHTFLADNFLAFDEFWQEFGDVFVSLK